jgi:diguanylate cyclase (GGDEF)-like protein/PAS domain S-box-containing protein
MKQEPLLTTILKYLKEGVFSLDKELRIVYVNPSAIRMCNSPEKAILGKFAPRTLTLLESKTLNNFFHAIPDRGGIARHFKDAILKVGGNTLIVDGSITALSDDAGNLRGYVIITRDVSELQKLHATLNYQARHDKLTGLVNREGFVVELDAVLDMVKRSGGHYFLLQINVDGFRRVTGNSGMTGGNSILIQFASTLKSVTQEGDIIARLANDIFAVICLENDSGYAENLAERIHVAVKRTVFSCNGKTYPLTVSVGIVQITHKTAFAEALLSAVDVACNSAKCTGGDKTLIA